MTGGDQEADTHRRLGRRYCLRSSWERACSNTCRQKDEIFTCRKIREQKCGVDRKSDGLTVKREAGQKHFAG